MLFDLNLFILCVGIESRIYTYIYNGNDSVHNRGGERHWTTAKRRKRERNGIGNSQADEEKNAALGIRETHFSSIHMGYGWMVVVMVATTVAVVLFCVFNWCVSLKGMQLYFIIELKPEWLTFNFRDNFMREIHTHTYIYRCGSHAHPHKSKTRARRTDRQKES